MKQNQKASRAKAQAKPKPKSTLAERSNPGGDHGAESDPAPERRRRKALSHVGGPAETHGDAAYGEHLARAMDVPPGEGTREHIHGFHSYPARMHPALAAQALRLLAEPGHVVLDPFCGSGTVLVEARALGAIAVGNDANPLACMLAEAKVNPPSEEEREELQARAQTIAELANERRKAKSGATRRYPRADVQLFAPHVLLELDSLQLGISEAPRRIQPHLWLILSSLLTKLSLRSGDSSQRVAPKRIAAGYAARLFTKRTAEVCEQWAAYLEALPGRVPWAEIFQGDARELAPFDDESVDAIVTSPPYPGNFDYHAHHELRLRWLGLDDRPFERQEVGARRHLEPKPAAGVIAWKKQFASCLAAWERVLVPGGRALCLIADSVVGIRAIYNDRLTNELAESVGLRPLAWASQKRPHFHRGSRNAFRKRPRQEHLILLEKP